MKAWLISVTAVCLLLILMELLLSEGKTKKFIQGILRLAMVIVLLSPVTALVKGNTTEINITEETKETATYDGLSDYIKRKAENEIEKRLNEMGGRCEAEILVGNGEIRFVEITVKENGINAKGENIYTNEKIIECVTDTVAVDKEKVLVYGAE